MLPSAQALLPSQGLHRCKRLCCFLLLPCSCKVFYECFTWKERKCLQQLNLQFRGRDAIMKFHSYWTQQRETTGESTGGKRQAVQTTQSTLQISISWLNLNTQIRTKLQEETTKYLLTAKSLFHQNFSRGFCISFLKSMPGTQVIFHISSPSSLLNVCHILYKLCSEYRG